jgi:hypothetical protein
VRKPTKKLQAEWSKRLADAGFEDIEDTSHPLCPLKDWHTLHFSKPEVVAAKRAAEAYQLRAETFLSATEFGEIAKILASKGTVRKLTRKDLRQLWQMHCEGETVRAIAAELGYGRSTIDDAIRKLREWMLLL